MEAQHLSGDAGALSGSTKRIAQASAAQNEAAASMAASVEEMTVSIAQVTEHSGEALRASQENGELARAGNAAVQSTAGEMHEIGAGAEELTRVIRELGEHSGRISTIVNVIHEIAGQTNLLALNAAIEAARAGEQGRGFSVVADEVRKLAERTSASTQEIGQMIEAIQGGTAQAVSHMEKWSQRVGAGVTRAQDASGVIERIHGNATQVAGTIGEISGALAEQASASTQIAQSVEGIARMSEENAVAVNGIAEAAQRIDRLARELSGSVSKFTLVA